MKREEISKNTVKVSKLLFISSLFLFAIIILQLSRLSLAETIDGVNLKKFANNRNTVRETLSAYRGNIYDVNGEALAQTVNAYTVIAYLDSKRDKGFKTPQHVVDKQMTAEALAPIINMEVERIYDLLSKEKLYQVELGPGGKGITELKKEAIEKLNLPGIDFVKTYKRYYPNEDFLSYTLGYAKKYDDNIVGEMGLEKYYDKELKGNDGYLEYQKDVNGYKIPNTPEVRKDEVDGDDIYLTIDSNIQLFVERIVKDTCKTYTPDWMLLTVMDAKTGRILGTSSSPSFNPNTKNITSYLDPLVSYAYEPGSTMKTWTYMAAMEKGTYKGTETYLSGNKKVGIDTVYDWNNEGWGTIDYNKGFTLSSNVGIANMLNNFIDKNDLKDYLKQVGFGKKTGITLPGEVNGQLDFKYPIEVVNAGFGQGITITPIQMLQALTTIANEGTMLKPYLIDKIINPNNNEIIFQGEKTELGRVAAESTIKQIKDLMYKVVNGDPSETTGYVYKMEGYDIIGKTGTAQYVNPYTGEYYEDRYIKSFAGMFPKDDPEIIVYTVVKNPVFSSAYAVVKPTKRIIEDVSKYLNLFPQVNNSTNAKMTEFEMPNFINESVEKTSSVLSDYSSDYYIIGNGSKIINQYPNAYLKINNHDKVFLVTNESTITLPKFYNWSSRDVLTYCHLASLECELEGYGYVYEQNSDNEGKLNFKLKNRFD